MPLNKIELVGLIRNAQKEFKGKGKISEKKIEEAYVEIGNVCGTERRFTRYLTEIEGYKSSLMVLFASKKINGESVGGSDKIIWDNYSACKSHLIDYANSYLTLITNLLSQREKLDLKKLDKIKNACSHAIDYIDFIKEHFEKFYNDNKLDGSFTVSFGTDLASLDNSLKLLNERLKTVNKYITDMDPGKEKTQKELEKARMKKRRIIKDSDDEDEFGKTELNSQEKTKPPSQTLVQITPLNGPQKLKAGNEIKKPPMSKSENTVPEKVLPPSKVLPIEKGNEPKRQKLMLPVVLKEKVEQTKQELKNPKFDKKSGQPVSKLNSESLEKQKIKKEETSFLEEDENVSVLSLLNQKKPKEHESQLKFEKGKSEETLNPKVVSALPVPMEISVQVNLDQKKPEPELITREEFADLIFESVYKFIKSNFINESDKLDVDKLKDRLREKLKNDKDGNSFSLYIEPKEENFVKVVNYIDELIKKQFASVVFEKNQYAGEIIIKDKSLIYTLIITLVNRILEKHEKEFKVESFKREEIKTTLNETNKKNEVSNFKNTPVTEKKPVDRNAVKETNPVEEKSVQKRKTIFLPGPTAISGKSGDSNVNNKVNETIEKGKELPRKKQKTSEKIKKEEYPKPVIEVIAPEKITFESSLVEAIKNTKNDKSKEINMSFLLNVLIEVLKKCKSVEEQRGAIQAYFKIKEKGFRFIFCPIGEGQVGRPFLVGFEDDGSRKKRDFNYDLVFGVNFGDGTTKIEGISDINKPSEGVIVSDFSNKKMVNVSSLRANLNKGSQDSKQIVIFKDIEISYGAVRETRDGSLASFQSLKMQINDLFEFLRNFNFTVKSLEVKSDIAEQKEIKSCAEYLADEILILNGKFDSSILKNDDPKNLIYSGLLDLVKDRIREKENDKRIKEEESKKQELSEANKKEYESIRFVADTFYGYLQKLFFELIFAVPALQKIYNKEKIKTSGKNTMVFPEILAAVFEKEGFTETENLMVSLTYDEKIDFCVAIKTEANNFEYVSFLEFLGLYSRGLKEGTFETPLRAEFKLENVRIFLSEDDFVDNSSEDEDLKSRFLKDNRFQEHRKAQEILSDKLAKGSYNEKFLEYLLEFIRSTFPTLEKVVSLYISYPNVEKLYKRIKTLRGLAIQELLSDKEKLIWMSNDINYENKKDSQEVPKSLTPSSPAALMAQRGQFAHKPQLPNQPSGNISILLTPPRKIN